MVKTTGHERLFWCVGTVASPTTNSCTATPLADALFIGGNSAYSGDLAVDPAAIRVDGQFRPSSLDDTADKIVVAIWRVTKTATANEADVEFWVRGAKGDTRTAGTTAGASPKGCAVGAMALSIYDSEGSSLYEMGGCDGNGTAFTDAIVDDLARHLCNKYDVDYMSVTTPIDIGVWAKTGSSATAVHDMPYWFKCDDQYLTRDSSGDITQWDMHELVSEHARDASTADTTGGNAPQALHGQCQHQMLYADSSNTEALREATTYDWSESTIFPASTGASVFAVYQHPATVSGGYIYAGAIGLRQYLTTGKIRLLVPGGGVTSTNDESGNWLCIIGTWLQSSGASTLDVNTDSTSATNGTTAITTTRVNMMQDDSNANRNTGYLREVAEYKHALSADEIATLQRYAVYWYGDEGNFGL